MQKRGCFRGQVDAILNTSKIQRLCIALTQSKPAKVETKSKQSLFLWKNMLVK